MAFSKNVQRLIFFIITAGCIQLLSSCQYFKSDHPQAALINQSSTTGMTEESVIAFAEDIEQSKNNLKKLSSLVYKRGQDNFFVEQYFNDHGDQVLIEHQQKDQGIQETSRRFYLKNDSLILVTSSDVENKANQRVYLESRTYLRNYTVFKRETKRANSANALTTAAYEPEDIKEINTPDYKAAIKRLQDALSRSNEFDLVFDKITEYPDATFIELKSQTPNGYAASVALEEKDAFADSLIRQPDYFKDNKINFNWKVQEMQAVYVPSGSTSTSANGLNR
jgi:hypothetical protein